MLHKLAGLPLGKFYERISSGHLSSSTSTWHLFDLPTGQEWPWACKQPIAKQLYWHSDDQPLEHFHALYGCAKLPKVQNY